AQEIAACRAGGFHVVDIPALDAQQTGIFLARNRLTDTKLTDDLILPAATNPARSDLNAKIATRVESGRGAALRSRRRRQLVCYWLRSGMSLALGFGPCDSDWI